MDLPAILSIAERLRERTIGNPEFHKEKDVFEYREKNIETVVILKLLRATQGIASLDLLCRNGLFIDMGAIFRCVEDCVLEVYFLLEKYPKRSDKVEKFIKAFFETTIDGYLSGSTEPVRTKTIHNAAIRSLTGLDQDNNTRVRLINVYKAFSGYIHANYSHIMEVYGGTPLSFNLGGVPSKRQREMRMEIVEQAYFSVLAALGYVASTFGANELHQEVLQMTVNP